MPNVQAQNHEGHEDIQVVICDKQYHERSRSHFPFQFSEFT